MQAAHRHLDAPPVGDQILCAVCDFGGAGQDALGFLVPWHQVGPLQTRELDAVLEQTKRPIRHIKFTGLSTSHIPRTRERAQGAEGVLRADSVIRCAVDQLEQLNGEFDVPKTTRAELDLIIHILGRDVVGDALAHLLDLLDETGPGGCCPNQWFECLSISRPQIELPSEGSSFDESLKLPVARPTLVVREV